MLSTLPIVADLPDSVVARRWIYYCVDDFSVWPGLDSTTMLEMERKYVRTADRIVAVSDVLLRHVEGQGREADLLTHGVDVTNWSSPCPETLEPESLASVDRPRVLFWGLIDRRLDIQWLQTLADRMDRGTIVLAGPEQNPDLALAAIPCLHRLGPIPFRELPQLAAACDVLVMPYADLPVTRAMQPLKLKEYLATGKPTVVRDLPATVDWKDALDPVGDAQSFANRVLERVSTGLPETQREARLRLTSETWKAKAARLRMILLDEPMADIHQPQPNSISAS